MKSRNGYVSNSSSCSFVIMVPENLDWNKLKMQDAIKRASYDVEEDVTDEQIETEIKRITPLIIEQGWMDEYNPISSDMFSAYTQKEIVEQLFDNYKLGSIEGGPGESTIVFVKQSKVEEIISQ